MISKTALLVVFALLVNSAALLLCQWECHPRDTGRHGSACHASQDASPILQAGTNHDCVTESPAIATTGAKHVEGGKPGIAQIPIQFRAFVSSSASSIPSPTDPSHAVASVRSVSLRI